MKKSKKKFVFGSDMTLPTPVEDDRTGMLPPADEPPVWPPRALRHDMREDYWYEPPVMPRAGTARYFNVVEVGGAPVFINWKWANEQHGGPRIGYAKGFGTLSTRPQIVGIAEGQFGGPASELHKYGLFLYASERVVEIFRQLDPDAIATCPIDWRLRDGTPLDQQYYFLDILRVIPAIDFANSRLLFRPDTEGGNYIADAEPLRFKPDIPEHYHVFRDARFKMRIFYSRTLCERLAALDPPLDNIKFEDPGYSTVEQHWALFPHMKPDNFIKFQPEWVAEIHETPKE